MAHALKENAPSPWRERLLRGALLLLACAAGFALRVYDVTGVFPEEGGVRLGVDDSYFHARRALYSFANFPEVLGYDWYLAYPKGAAAPAPPLFDWLMAGTARLFGDDQRTFELVAAWTSPLLGALFALPAFWIGRAMAGAGVGLSAAWLVSIIPAGILNTSLGNCDHHGVVALCAALWLAAILRETRLSGRRLAWHALLHAGIVSAMLLTWSGSLLYLAVGEGARVAAILLFRPQPARFFAQAGSAALAAAGVSLWLASSEPPLGGAVTSQTLSWLHPIALLSLAGLTAGLGLLERLRPAQGAGGRLARALLLAGGVALPSLLLAEVRETLAIGLDFLGKQDVWAESNPEQRPLFHALPTSRLRSATERFGFFAYLVPLAPLFVAYRGWRAPADQRGRWLVLFCWVGVVCGLVLFQVRYGTDSAVPTAVVFAIVLVDLRGSLARKLPAAATTAIVAALTLVLLWPALALLAARITFTARQLLDDESLAVPSSRRDIMFEFGEQMRRYTPETRGFLDRTERPAYGILVPPRYGHLFTYLARRPVSANNLGPYLDTENFERTWRFYRTADAREALRILDALEARYVVTGAEAASERSFARTLHSNNDAFDPERDYFGTGQLRLVALSQDGPDGRPYFKLFERVKGARIVASGPPQTLATAKIRLATPAGPEWFQTSRRVNASGVLRMRLPYASAQPGDESAPVRALGLWQLELGSERHAVAVSEAQVREGRKLRIQTHPPSDRGQAEELR